ncbi:hypothetical protein [Massilia rhizosphaerae]|uniref:hypothetical protein n=1 Tax=Massilia rhizosphaerae TaxID=2784389 RepID=UPI0018DC0748|nr:hypothetical protein [Massilia rhizosphaerae]
MERAKQRSLLEQLRKDTDSYSEAIAAREITEVSKAQALLREYELVTAFQKKLEAVDRMQRDIENLKRFQPDSSVLRIVQEMNKFKEVYAKIEKLNVMQDVREAWKAAEDASSLKRMQSEVERLNSFQRNTELANEFRRDLKEVTLAQESLNALKDAYGVSAAIKRAVVPPLALPLTDPNSSRLVQNAVKRVMTTHADVIKALANR